MQVAREKEILAQIESLLQTKRYAQLKAELEDLYPMDIAEVFNDISDEDCVILFRLLSKDKAAEVFSYLSKQRRKSIVSVIHVSLLNHILDELYFDDKIDFLEEMPANFVKTLLANAPAEERTMVHQFLNFPDNSAGTLMTIEYVDLKKHMTVEEALKRIKAIGMDSETIYTLYVLDETRKMEGIVSLRRLVLADKDEIIGNLMHTDVVMTKVYTDQEEVADLFKKYDLTSLPVVDNEQRLIGIITIDDIVDVIEQENTEDFQKMAAMAPTQQEYLHTNVFVLARKRVGWLLFLMVSATFTGAIMTYYEDLLTAMVVLASSIPMLMDSGGNSGSQSSTLIIRGIALGEIELKDWPKVLWKEFRVSFIVGAILALVNFGRMMIITGSTINVALTVSLTLLAVVMIAKIIGGLLPMGAKALRLDPAIMAGPMITTIVDALALMIYFGIATALLIT